MRITFCGANREVTGSCYLIETKDAKVVLDCGMFQGGRFAEEKNTLPFPFNPQEIEAVVLTHAHLDHNGRLPKMYKEGFRGKIWCTKPSAEMSMITLRDAVHLMEEESQRHGHEPLYVLEEVEPLEAMWQLIEYHQEKEIAPGIRIFLTDAGHILGSASVRISTGTQEAVFSGDLGNSPVPLLHNLECQYTSDLVIIESTYGNRVHESHALRASFLKDAILECVRRKGVLLIPAFAVERTQELLFELHHLHHQKEIPTLPIFLDSPMAIAVTEVFSNNLDYLDLAAQAIIKADRDPFHFPGVVYTEKSVDSKAILRQPEPKIIIAGSGMMNGGRILHHLKNYLHNPKTIVLVVGFQAEGSLGRRLHDKEKKVHIFGQEIEVKADIRSCGAFSGHADYPGLMQWLNCFQSHPPSKIFVTHGELNSALSFSQSIEENLGISSAVPEFGESVDVSSLTLNKNNSPVPAPRWTL